LLTFAEWRGVSYVGGGDPGAITIPNVRHDFHLSFTPVTRDIQLFKSYSRDLRGASVGYNVLPEICFGSLCPIGMHSYTNYLRV
jgi:phospholipase B1